MILHTHDRDGGVGDRMQASAKFVQAKQGEGGKQGVAEVGVEGVGWGGVQPSARSWSSRCRAAASSRQRPCTACNHRRTARPGTPPRTTPGCGWVGGWVGVGPGALGGSWRVSWPHRTARTPRPPAPRKHTFWSSTQNTRAAKRRRRGSSSAKDRPKDATMRPPYLEGGGRHARVGGWVGLGGWAWVGGQVSTPNLRARPRPPHPACWVPLERLTWGVECTGRCRQ